MKHILLIVFMTVFSTAYSQQPQRKTLSLAEALELALTNNYDLRESLADVGIAKSQLSSANAAFLPNIELSENYVNTNDPLNVFGLKLKQGTVSSNDFNPELLNDPENIENFNTRVTVQQPLINVDAFSQRSALRHFYEASQMSHQRKLQYISYLTKNSYYGLLLADMNISIARKSVETAQEGYDIANDNFKAGYILQSDVLAAEVRLLTAQNYLSSAEAEHYNAVQQFKYLLGVDDNTKLVLSDSLSLPETEVLPHDSLAVNEERSDMKALKFVSEGHQKMLNSNRFRYLPNLNMMASYEWNDDTAFGNNADNYLLGVSLKWKLFDGYRREAEIQKTKSQLDKSQITSEKQLAQANIELRNALRQLEITYNQIKTYQLAASRAEDLYKIKKDRYKVGLEKTVDLIDAETNVYQQKTALQNALFKYYSSIFTIEYLLEQEII